MSVNFMNGQHQLVHFYKGKNTPALDVLQVINMIILLFPIYTGAMWINSFGLGVPVCICTLDSIKKSRYHNMT